MCDAKLRAATHRQAARAADRFCRRVRLSIAKSRSPATSPAHSLHESFPAILALR